MCVIPFVFIRFGDGLRERSEFCRFLKQQKIEEAERVERVRRESEGVGRVGSEAGLLGVQVLGPEKMV